MRNVCQVALSANNTSTQNSSKIDSGQLIAISFHAIFSDSAAAGTLKLQASNDPCAYTGPNAAQFTPTNWVDIPNQSASVTSGASALLTITQCTYRWLRVVWTSSGGAGTITVNFNALSM